MTPRRQQAQSPLSPGISSLSSPGWPGEVVAPRNGIATLALTGSCPATKAAIAAAAKELRIRIVYFSLARFATGARTMREIFMLWDSVTVLALFGFLATFLWIIISKWLR